MTKRFATREALDRVQRFAAPPGVPRQAGLLELDLGIEAVFHPALAKQGDSGRLFLPPTEHPVRLLKTTPARR